MRLVSVVGTGVPIFGVFFLFIMAIAAAPFAFGLYALISIATTPEHFFGPWWDNTRSTWLIGVAVSFVIPFGTVVTAIMWITTGRRGLRAYGLAGRPFWAGQPKPGPPWGYGPPQ